MSDAFAYLKDFPATQPNYSPYITKTALDASPVVMASSDGIQAIHTGADAAALANNSASNAPQNPQGFGLTFNEFLNNLPLIGPAAQIGVGTGMAIAEKPKAAAVTKNIVYGALIVVIGLLVLSRGFGLLGEEGSDIVVNLGNPKKYPGIGHAIQGLKNRAGTAAVAAE